GDAAMLRLAHEAVLRGWARARDIVAREEGFYRIRQEVSSAGMRWRVTKRTDLLFAPGVPLGEAQSLISTYADELSPAGLGFVAASVRKQHARQRRAYVLATAFGLVAIAAITGGILAWQAERVAEQSSARAFAEAARAEKERTRAEQQSTIARDRQVEAERQ